MAFYGVLKEGHIERMLNYKPVIKPKQGLQYRRHCEFFLSSTFPIRQSKEVPRPTKLSSYLQSAEDRP